MYQKQELDMKNNSRRISGFTLVELVVTISIAGILLGLAVPSFKSIVTGYKLTAYANKLVSSLCFARSEAVKRGVQISIRKKSATTMVWESGWDVFVDNVQVAGNVAGTLDGTDVLLKTYEPLTTGYTIRTGSNYTCWLSYTAQGVSLGSGTACTGGAGLGSDIFRICDTSANTAIALAIAISPTGRTSTTKGTTACP